MAVPFIAFQQVDVEIVGRSIAEVSGCVLTIGFVEENDLEISGGGGNIGNSEHPDVQSVGSRPGVCIDYDVDIRATYRCAVAGNRFRVRIVTRIDDGGGLGIDHIQVEVAVDGERYVCRYAISTRNRDIVPILKVSLVYISGVLLVISWSWPRA